jgi:peptidyl-prolyl cis-trans isomerase SurA
VSVQEKQDAIARLDSIVRLVRLDSLKFDIAAMRYSQDEDTRLNGGQAVNHAKGGTRWGMDEFQPAEYAIINKMKVGEISDPYESIDSKGKQTYKVIWLKNRTNPHVGDLKNDYNLFKARALQIKQKEIINNWVEDKIKTTYIKLSSKYKNCPFLIHGWQKT